MEWIKVKHSLPEFPMWVLVFVQYSAWHESFYDGNEFTFYDRDLNDWAADPNLIVTHWMPISSPAE